MAEEKKVEVTEKVAEKSAAPKAAETVKGGKKPDAKIRLVTDRVSDDSKHEIGIVFNGEEKTIIVEKREYVMDNRAEYYPFRDYLIQNGFVDKTDYALTSDEVIVRPSEKKWTFTLEETKGQKDVSIGVVADGQDIEARFDGGQFVTTNRTVAEKLRTTPGVKLSKAE